MIYVKIHSISVINRYNDVLDFRIVKGVYLKGGN